MKNIFKSFILWLEERSHFTKRLIAYLAVMIPSVFVLFYLAIELYNWRHESSFKDDITTWCVFTTLVLVVVAIVLILTRKKKLK